MTPFFWHYILDAHGQPVPCDDLLVWGRWMESAERHVAHDMDEGDATGAKVRVSTVFLGLDHNYRAIGPPLLWETMVFGGVLDGAMDRYTSLRGAVDGHYAMCERVRATIHR